MASTNNNKTFLLTGGNRGIGFGLVKALLGRSSTTVVASVRNESTAEEFRKEAAALPKGTGSKAIAIVLDLATMVDPIEIRSIVRYAMTDETPRIDVLISNAGLVTSMGPALTTTAADMLAHTQANAIAPLILFQACWPLMQSAQPPKFIAISSSVGSIEQQEPLPGGAYGPSKAALNWLTKRLHRELEKDGLVSIAVHPGWVQTAMGQFAADAWRYPGQPPLSVEQSVEGLLNLIDGSKRENASGKFLSYDGSELKW